MAGLIQKRRLVWRFSCSLLFFPARGWLFRRPVDRPDKNHPDGRHSDGSRLHRTGPVFGKPDHLFLLGLLLIAVGTGIFKVNMAVMVGNIYKNQPELKDAGFNIYYMGVNLGAMIAPL